MKSPFNGNWGLKLLALTLAIVIYYALKNETAGGKAGNRYNHDRNFFQQNH